MRIGKYNQALSDRLRISWNMSTAFHPRTDGPSDNMSCTVEDMLRHFVSPTMTNWKELLVHAQFAVNSPWQKSVQNTPFYLNHGRRPGMPWSASLESGRTLHSITKIPASAAVAKPIAHAKTYCSQVWIPYNAARNSGVLCRVWLFPGDSTST